MREDAAIETDLVHGGYRDRLLTELAQNAADAASSGGRLAVWLDGSSTLHIANTGAALTESGVQALAALRASSKTGGVGRFGVGFTSVLSVSDEIAIRSTSGSVCFSAERTHKALLDNGIDAAIRPSTLRLVWPVSAAPASGWDTEILLELRDDVDPGALLEAMRAEAVDLLLELPALTSIQVGAVELVRHERDLGGGVTELEIGGHRWRQFRTPRVRWLLPAAGPVQSDVLRAPTRSDEELSLPVLAIVDIAMAPDRRRVLPGQSFGDIASGYTDFARALPAGQRLSLVPAPGFARSEVDATLREALLAELRDANWLPVIGGSERPSRASVLRGLTVDLADLLADVIPGLVIPELTRNTAALTQLGVTRLGLAGVAELLSGLDRPPSWWGEIYAALEPLATDPLAAQELGALPVPLTDGRLVTGPRTTVLAEIGEHVFVGWARVVHPDAAHPLLARLGAQRASALELLADPVLRGAIAEADDDLVDAVLRLAGQLPAAAELPSWLGELELPDTAGALVPADELLLPDAPLVRVLMSDSPFGVVSGDLVARHSAKALRAIGVGWGFTVLTEQHPTGPDHDLDDEQQWWDALESEPETLSAVRDLDLVDDARWPEALELLAADPQTAPLLLDRAGYTAWWLRTHAVVDGTPVGLLRYPDDPTFAGLLDPWRRRPDADALRGLLADAAVTINVELAQALIDALGDPNRYPTPGVVAETHRLLAAANLDSDSIAPPVAVRAVTGSLVDAERALVVDRPWYALVIEQDRAVIGDIAGAPALATLLDLPMVSEVVCSEVVSVGEPTTWEREPLGVLLRVAVGMPGAHGDLVLHDTLEVRLTGAVEATVRPPWWVSGAVTHLNRQSFVQR